MGILQRFSVLFIVGIILLMSAIIFSWKLATRSQVLPGSTEDAQDLGDTTQIYRNNFGIPHIVARSEADAFYALGYAHAQDRLWQMDLFRRIGRGQLAEIFDSTMIVPDKFFRVLGIGRMADNQSRNLSKQSLNALEAYSRGVNCFINNQKNNYPFEFGALGYQPAPWKPADCLVIGKLMSFDMSMSFWTDIAIGEIADTLGVDKALQFIPSYPASSPAVVESGATQQEQTHDSAKSISHLQRHYSPEYRQALSSIAATMNEVREKVGLKGMSSGSNCWVMRKSQASSSTGGRGVILANDPHLSLGLPPRWYQVHLTCPQFNAIGNSIPGVPGIISGRNDQISWGITNVMLDDFDYFFEKTDPSNSAYYYNSEGARVKFKYLRDTIKVHKHPLYVFDIRQTARSGIISDVHPSRAASAIIPYPSSSPSLPGKYVLSFSWAAREHSDEVAAVLRLMKAKNWSDFIDGVNMWNTPPLNFCYADVRGNMGIAPAGGVPIRGEGNPNFPHPGWDARFAWQGVRKSDALPRLYNPTRGFVFSANNLTTRNAGFHISSLWEPPSRAERIEESLKEYADYSARDAQFMQLDVLSPNARYVLKHTMGILQRDTTWFTSYENTALQKLAAWDYVLSAQDAAPAIYTAFHERLMYNVFTYKISPQLYKKYAFVGSLPIRKLNEIIADSSCAWFSADAAQGRAIFENILRQSFKDGVRILFDRYGYDPNNFHYGDLHPLILKHPFHAQEAMRPVVTKELRNIGGDATTLNNALWRIHDPFAVTVGVSMRFVADMQDSVVYSVVPGGVSGQPLDAHYADQLQLWSNGGYIPLNTHRKPDETFILFTTLIPKRD